MYAHVRYFTVQAIALFLLASLVEGINVASLGAQLRGRARLAPVAFSLQMAADHKPVQVAAIELHNSGKGTQLRFPVPTRPCPCA